MLDTMNKLKRSHYCGLLRTGEAGEQVTLTGWVQRRRDHGGLIFIDLRDRTGLVQIVFSPDLHKEAFDKAENVRNEYVLAVTGVVRIRPEGTANPNLATGEIDVVANTLLILNRAKTPPFYIEDDIDVDENLRLRYRYLDLRRPVMQETLRLRHRISKSVRDFLDEKGFLEIETPMLSKSTPEGARDYLVPSRVNPGKFYALPQSPQIYKQILMVSGIDKYFQIVRCFRDEDLRADRQPEFTQIDIEMSFIDVDDILGIMEEMVSKLCRDSAGMDIPRPFPRLTYREAMDRFGSDKPDTRFGLELKDVSDIAANCGFKVFNSVIEAGGQVKGINASGCATFSRKEIDDLISYAAIYKAKGLAYFMVTDNGVKSTLSKFFNDQEMAAIVDRLEGKPGDLLLFVADQPPVVAGALGALRLHLAERLGLIPVPGAEFFGSGEAATSDAKGAYSSTQPSGARKPTKPEAKKTSPENSRNFLWVVDFPLLEYSPEDKRYYAMHHPFTAPKEEDLPLLESDPGKALANAYDLVLNGVEIGGGSIRIYRRDIQEKMFAALGIGAEEAVEKFGFMLEAFDYGTPPHGGIAFGLDRLVMLLANRNTIRDVIAFPKTQSAADLMNMSPDPVSPAQLKELSIKLAIKGQNKETKTE